jgi:hypothetical protein
LEVKVGKIFIDKTKAEIDEENSSNEPIPSGLNIKQQDRKRSYENCLKCGLRNEIINVSIAVSALSSLINNEDDEVSAKAKMIYWRLIDIVLKLDHIDGKNNGIEYLNLNELGTHTHLASKF